MMLYPTSAGRRCGLALSARLGPTSPVVLGETRYPGKHSRLYRPFGDGSVRGMLGWPR